jgi:hypothetical protein
MYSYTLTPLAKLAMADFEFARDARLGDVTSND